MTDTFTVNYTNKDIMDKLDLISQKLDYTNGSVKTHTKLIYGAYGFTLSVLGFLVICL